MGWKTKNGNRVYLIDFEPDAPEICELCGKKFIQKDLRPYGPNDEWVCFDCGMKNEEVAVRKYINRISN